MYTQGYYGSCRRLLVVVFGDGDAMLDRQAVLFFPVVDGLADGVLSQDRAVDLDLG